MKNEINLLNTKTKSPLSALASKIDILRTIAVFLLFLVAFLSVTFFFLVLVSPLPALRREENAKRLALRSLYGKITDLYIINDRVDTISEVLGKRTDFGGIIHEISSDLPSGVAIDSMNSVNKKILFNVSSTSLQNLQIYLDRFVESNQTSKKFKSITQSDLSVSAKNNKVQVQISVEL